jgi:xylulokinase
VYLNERFASTVGALDSQGDLASQLAPTLSRRTSPIWMDSSTSTECAEIGKAGDVQGATGSPPIERFTGPQIRKFFKTDAAAYNQTRRIHLVSSFLCSVLIGGDAPIDTGDGAGMNLLNLKTLAWDAAIAEATAPGLLERLPRVQTNASLPAGNLCGYFAKYGLKPGIPVAVWTGDNPASLIGCGAFGTGTAVVSLGTSDTFFAVLDPYRVDPDGYGHVFGQPAGGFMCLTCFKNGSLARDRVRKEAGMDWGAFNQFVSTHTEPGKWALPWFEPEITPLATKPGLHANFDFAAAAPEVQVRAVVESQALSMRSHSRWMGEFAVLRVTGGASQSSGILQTFADVFGATVETISIPDSAALGAAIIAAHVGGGLSFAALARTFCPASQTLNPRKELTGIYAASLDAFQKFETASIAN